jgi:hypothetical protein
VFDQSGAPVGGAEVVLQLAHVAYRGTQEVREDRQNTPETGGVVFMYISDQATTPYVLTVQKSGFVRAELTGVATASGQGAHVRVTLVPAEGPQ